jgi:hypothetical protein
LESARCQKTPRGQKESRRPWIFTAALFSSERRRAIFFVANVNRSASDQKFAARGEQIGVRFSHRLILPAVRPRGPALSWAPPRYWAFGTLVAIAQPDVECGRGSPDGRIGSAA